MGQGNGEGSIFAENVRYSVATVCQSWEADEDEDNARLIAAGPRLLSALLALSDEFDSYSNAMAEFGRGHEDYGRQRDEARAAIAQALGGTS